MGKKAQQRRGDTQPKIDHFIMSTDGYIAIRRYLGSRPHDETRDCIVILEQLPAITVDDVALRATQAERLAELEEILAPEDESPETSSSPEKVKQATNGEDKGAIVDDLPETVACPDCGLVVEDLAAHCESEDNACLYPADVATNDAPVANDTEEGS